MVERRASRANTTRNELLVLGGSALFLLSVVLPVMRWRKSEHHSSGGSARVFVGDGYTLVDGGFSGTALVPVAALAVVVVAVAALAARVVPWAWYVQATAAVVACYYPIWVAYVFAKKLEDEVFPGEGLVALVLAYAAILWGTWAARPISRRPASAG
jgi:hypothetical protein